MAKAYITEHRLGLRTDSGNHIQIPGDYGIDQVVDFTAGATQSTAFNSTTRYISIGTDSTCSIAFGDNPTATTSNRRLPANFFGYFPVSGGQKVSFISNT